MFECRASLPDDHDPQRLRLLSLLLGKTGKVCVWIKFGKESVTGEKWVDRLKKQRWENKNKVSERRAGRRELQSGGQVCGLRQSAARIERCEPRKKRERERLSYP